MLSSPSVSLGPKSAVLLQDYFIMISQCEPKISQVNFTGAQPQPENLHSGHRSLAARQRLGCHAGPRDAGLPAQVRTNETFY